MSRGSEREIQLAVRIRPGPSPAVDVGEDGKVVVSPGGERFGYPSRVVKGNDQTVAFDALASVLIDRAREGYNCTLMAYGQTGSGKTHTMFGPAGCLTEASVQQAASGSASSSAIPAAWGLFPRAVLTLLRLESVQSLHASAVEVYHESIFDLMDDRAQLSIGTAKPIGTKVAGASDLGGAFSRNMAINGVHPASCTCHGCFKAKEAAKQAKEAERLARVQQAEEAIRSAKTARSSASRASGIGAASSSSESRSSLSASPVCRTATTASGSASPSSAGGAAEDSFATVGERLTPLRSAEEVARFARTVEATRTAKSHLLNDRSSRSHCLVKVHVTRRPGAAGPPASGSSSSSTPSTPQRVATSTLLFVDLAGSERLQRTGAEGAARAEAQSINSSLSALGRVIKSLGAGQHQGKRASQQHVPYRDAALTMLLRDSFGGRSCTSVVINVAGEQEHAEESICSLRFGERMSVVRNSPTVVIGNDAGDTARLQAMLEQARRELARMTAEGLGGGFVESAPNSEKQSLAENMRKLADTEREVRDCIAQIAEARSRGAGTAPLEQRLRSSTAQAEVFQGIVERQQTIKTLWALPTPGFRRKAAELKELESRVMLALGL